MEIIQGQSLSHITKNTPLRSREFITAGTDFKPLRAARRMARQLRMQERTPDLLRGRAPETVPMRIAM